MMTIQEQADKILQNEVLALINDIAEVLIRAGYNGVDTSGIDYENLTSKYDEETEEYQEIYQYYLVTSGLGEDLEELGEQVIYTDFAAIWCRCGCGYGLEADMEPVAALRKKRLDEQQKRFAANI